MEARLSSSYAITLSEQNRRLDAARTTTAQSDSLPLRLQRCLQEASSLLSRSLPSGKVSECQRSVP